jgi:hypothetical protein
LFKLRNNYGAILSCPDVEEYISNSLEDYLSENGDKNVTNEKNCLTNFNLDDNNFLRKIIDYVEKRVEELATTGDYSFRVCDFLGGPRPP